jgi:hypothetical protein
MNKGFSKKVNSTSNEQVEGTVKKEVPFVRDESDNKLFKSIQVKNIQDIITEDCVGGWDFDGVIYRACANMENRLVRVVNEAEGINEVLPNVTTFKGRGKKVSETSWLGLLNIDREVEGKSLLTPEDFEITPFQELKMDEDKAIEQVKIQVFMKIKQVKQQFRIPNIKLLLGQGSSFRTDMDQVRRYKGNREETLRPLLLKKMRKWILDELDSELITTRSNGDTVEADDGSNIYGVSGYQHWRKYGKFNKIELSPDKDSLGAPKLLINPDTHVGNYNPLKGKFKFPQAMLIEATDRCAGDVELVVKGGEKTTTKELKGFGYKYLIYQAILGKDGADNYSALGHLPHKLGFGDVAAYKVLKPCKTAKETLQAALDVVADLLPNGVEYTSHKGEDLHVDTLTYLNNYFLTAYMLRSLDNDDMDLFKLCEAFKVDTSRVINNHIEKKLEVASEDSIRDTFEGAMNVLDSLQDILGNTKGKKDDLIERMVDVGKQLGYLQESLKNGLFLEETK